MPFNIFVITFTTLSIDIDKVQVRRLYQITSLVFSLQFMPDRNSLGKKENKKKSPSGLTVQFSMYFNVL
jgi:hypothetical protein